MKTAWVIRDKESGAYLDTDSVINMKYPCFAHIPNLDFEDKKSAQQFIDHYFPRKRGYNQGFINPTDLEVIEIEWRERGK